MQAGREDGSEGTVRDLVRRSRCILKKSDNRFPHRGRLLWMRLVREAALLYNLIEYAE